MPPISLPKLLVLALVLLLLGGCANPAAATVTPPATHPILAATATAPSVGPSATPVPLASVTPTPAIAEVPIPGDPLTGNGRVARTTLTFDQLMSGPDTGLVDGSAFALPANAAPPTHRFEGRLDLESDWLNGGDTVLRDDLNLDQLIGVRGLPPLSLTFVQSGSYLIPAQPGLILTDHPFWNLIVGPGRVWDEAGDAGYSRASFPLTLVERNVNCVHNGALLFLFNANSVSRAQFQIAQETCLYLKFNLWGQLAAKYTPGPLADASILEADYAQEVARRLPTKAFTALAADYPAAQAQPAAFVGGLTLEHVTAYGLLINGVNYVGGCQTRAGPYPYCESLRLPSYSAAKSAFAAVALMRLGQKYGTGVYHALISAYVPEAAQNPAHWAGVTFVNALDMATGYYRSPADEVDESDPAYQLNFVVAESYAAKMAAAFSFPRQRPPGQLWVYHSSDIFILTQAMNAYLRAQAGPQADIFNLVRDDVYRPLGLSAGALTTVRTGNDPGGAPLGAYGLFWTPDDIAKIANLLNADRGRIAGQQVLEPGLLAAAMQQDSADRGLNTTGSPVFKYNHAFWALHVTQPCDAWVPFMSGYGGIIVALLPNGGNYYYFSDNGEYNWFSAVAASNRIAPFCR